MEKKLAEFFMTSIDALSCGAGARTASKRIRDILF
jgi:hypothetical protein